MNDMNVMNDRNQRKSYKQSIAFLLLLSLFLGLAGGFASQTVLASTQKSVCKTLCGKALKATGGSSKLKYSSESTLDFGGLPLSAGKKVESISYVCDSKEVYSLCVMKAKSAKDAKKLLKAMKKYKKSNCSSNYLSDYSAEERKVFQNAIYGKKGSYVWYIAMSGNKSNNIKGQSALKKAI